ncbi:MAG: hypothetical protein IPK24_04955 [Kineosporiaceae bacterium]|nr:hypothetical protein [Kineosporiaceae bacterium]
MRDDLAAAAPLVAAALGTALSLIGTGCYLRDVRRGTTTPHRGSWLVWAVIAVMAAASHAADGGRWGVVALIGQAVATLAVLVLAVPRGVGGITAGNAAMLAVALVGVLGWVTLDDPTAAAACAAIADGAGLVAIVPKIWADPHSETAATYALAGVTGLLTILAVGRGGPALLLFPVYFCLANTATAQLIVLRRRAVVPSRGAAPVAVGDRSVAARLPQQRVASPELFLAPD